MDLPARVAGIREALGDMGTLLRSVLLVVLALGLTLALSALLAPEWPVLLLIEPLPSLVLWIIQRLDVGLQAAMILAGALLTLVATGVFIGWELWVRAHQAEHVVLREQMRLRFLATASFVVGFVTARTLVVLSGIASSSGRGGASGGNAGILPVRELWLQGYHIHHFFYGFVALVLVGWLALFRPGVSKRWLAVLYGLGLGIFVDEFGMLLTWGDHFARSSWSVAVTFLSLLLLGMLWTWSRARARSGPETGARGA